MNNEDGAYHHKRRYGDMSIHRLVNSLGSELMDEKSTAHPPLHHLHNNGIKPQIIRRTIVQEGAHIYKKVGDTLRLECHVDGVPPPTIVWYKVRYKFGQWQPGNIRISWQFNIHCVLKNIIFFFLIVLVLKEIATWETYMKYDFSFLRTHIICKIKLNVT